jgi:hypothetical protein
MGTYRGFVIVAEQTRAGFHIRATNGTELLDIFDDVDDEREALLVAQNRIDEFLGEAQTERISLEHNRA